MSLLSEARKKQQSGSLLSSVRSNLGVSSGIDDAFKRMQENELNIRNTQVQKSVNDSQQNFQNVNNSWLNKINTFLGRGVSSPTLINETPEYTAQRKTEESKQMPIMNRVAELGKAATFGAGNLLSDFSESVGYQLGGKQNIEKLNQQNTDTQNKITSLVSDPKVSVETKKKLIEISKQLKPVLGSDIYDFAKKTPSQVVGESVGTLFDYLTFGVASTGFKTALSKGGITGAVKFLGTKEGAKFLGKQFLSGLSTGAGGGLGIGLQENQRGKELAKTVGENALVMGVAQPVLAVGGAGVAKTVSKGTSKILDKLISKRVVNRATTEVEKELGKLNADEISIVREAVDNGLTKDDAITSINELRNIDKEIEIPKETKTPTTTVEAQKMPQVASKVEKGVKTPVNPLIQEAGKTLHRGDTIAIPFNKLDTGAVFKSGEKEALSAFNNTPGIYFTDSIDNAKSYGKNITSVNIKPDANIINVNDAPKILKRADVEKIIRSNPDIKDWSMNWSENFDDAIKQMTDSVMQEKDGNEFLKAIWSDGGFSPQDFTTAMKNAGIDGLKVPKEGVEHYVVYNKDILNQSKGLQEGVAKVEPKIDIVKTSKIAKSIEQKMKDAGMIDEGVDIEKATFEGITVKGQSEKMAEIVQDKQLVDDIISGKKELPSDVRPSTFIKGVEDNIKDPETLRKLAKSDIVSRTSYSAQDLRMAAERDPDSAVIKMREIIKAREEALNKKLKGKTSISKAKKEVEKSIEKATRAKKSNKATWKSFIEDIKCK